MGKFGKIAKVGGKVALGVLDAASDLFSIYDSAQSIHHENERFKKEMNDASEKENNSNIKSELTYAINNIGSIESQHRTLRTNFDNFAQKTNAHLSIIDKRLDRHDYQIGQLQNHVALHDRQIGQLQNHVALHDRQIGQLTR